MMLNQYNKQCSQSSDENSIISICLQKRHVLNRSSTVDDSLATTSTTTTDEQRQSVVVMSNGPRSDSSRDSGTSSPQPNEILGKLLNGNSSSSLHTKMSVNVHHTDLGSATTKTTTDNDIDSDSSDSVISTNSTNCSLDEDSLPSVYDERREYEVRDIYLGGSCMLRTKWRREIAIPYLKKHQITYYLPTLHENLTLKQMRKLNNGTDESLYTTVQETEEHESDSSTPIFNPKILEASRVLLFVITKETRSLAPMTLAAHCIGLGYNVVLCVQTLPEDCKIGHEQVSCFESQFLNTCLTFLHSQLTASAIKDFNRGRSYLKDLARRQNIPVFSEIKEAIRECIDKIKLSKPRSSV